MLSKPWGRALQRTRKKEDSSGRDLEEGKGAWAVHRRQGGGGWDLSSKRREASLCTCSSCRERDQSLAGGATCQPDIGCWISGTKNSQEEVELFWEYAGEPRLLMGVRREGLMVACLLEET